jgi:uncharacterized protein with von Willebrand factor type A (vWA) domain
MREALAAALVKNEADRESFDQVFARFFGAGDGRGEGAASAQARRASRLRRRSRRAWSGRAPPVNAPYG